MLIGVRGINITAAVRLIGSLYIMIYRVAERAVGWWLGSGRGRPPGERPGGHRGYRATFF